MKIKLDENLPAELAEDLSQLGHDADTVADEGLAGARDELVIAAANRDSRVLFTLDKGIADFHRFPQLPGAGVVLFRPESMGRGTVLEFIRARLLMLQTMDLNGRLTVVGASRVRIRP
ncbi:MAG: DUF5615 family PIN-like protein [Acidobacteria bacterium]|nr:DUF5615 family PIN-like protein [Acidobacteriota bacterium]